MEFMPQPLALWAVAGAELPRRIEPRSEDGKEMNDIATKTNAASRSLRTT